MHFCSTHLFIEGKSSIKGFCLHSLLAMYGKKGARWDFLRKFKLYFFDWIFPRFCCPRFENWTNLKTRKFREKVVKRRCVKILHKIKGFCLQLTTCDIRKKGSNIRFFVKKSRLQSPLIMDNWGLWIIFVILKTTVLAAENA